MGKKRLKQGSSSSEVGKDMAASKYESLQSRMYSLNKVVTDGFANIHTDIDNLRLEFKTEIEELIKDIEKSLESTQDVESINEDVKKVADDLLKSTNTLNGKSVKLEQFSKSPEVTEALNAKIVKLETQLKQQVEGNIRLEQYTRRENRHYSNITETEDEDCKSVIQNIIHYYISQLIRVPWLVNFAGRISLLYGPLYLKDSFPARPINHRDIINILLTSFSRSVL